MILRANLKHKARHIASQTRDKYRETILIQSTTDTAIIKTIRHQFTYKAKFWNRSYTILSLSHAVFLLYFRDVSSSPSDVADDGLHEHMCLKFRISPKLPSGPTVNNKAT